MTLTSDRMYVLSKADNILVVEAQGAFNEITIKQYSDDIKNLLDEFKHQAWATLAIFSGNGVFTPEAEQALIDITYERKKNNMAAIATVFKGCAQTDLQQMQLSRIYQSCNVAHHFFSDKDSAAAWLGNVLNDERAVS